MDKRREHVFKIQVKALVFDEKGNILVLKKTKKIHDDSSEKAHWELPGGNLEFGENVYNAVWRTVKDDTDLDTEVLRPTNVHTIKSSETTHIVGITFECKWDWETYYDDISEDDDDEPIFLSKEYNDYKWISPRDIIRGKFPVWMKEEIRKLENGQ